jgi:hypothetical protein
MSSGKTTPLPVSPSFSAFRLLLDLPSSVFGPVLFKALARFAASRFSLLGFLALTGALLLISGSAVKVIVMAGASIGAWARLRVRAVWLMNVRAILRDNSPGTIASLLDGYHLFATIWRFLLRRAIRKGFTRPVPSVDRATAQGRSAINRADPPAGPSDLPENVLSVRDWDNPLPRPPRRFDYP